jgi:hypothetical protein
VRVAAGLVGVAVAVAICLGVVRLVGERHTAFITGLGATGHLVFGTVVVLLLAGLAAGLLGRRGWARISAVLVCVALAVINLMGLIELVVLDGLGRHDGAPSWYFPVGYLLLILGMALYLAAVTLLRSRPAIAWFAGTGRPAPVEAARTTQTTQTAQATQTAETGRDSASQPTR